MLLFLMTAQCADARSPEESVVFYFRPNSEILVYDYRDNRESLNRLRTIFSRHKTDIRNGRGYFRVVSSVDPADTDDIYSINNASIEGSVVRAYLKVWYAIPHDQVTFCIDNTRKRSNQVELIYIDEPLEPSAWQNIFYTMSRNNASYVREAISNYEPIPFINGGVSHRVDLAENTGSQEIVTANPEPPSIVDMVEINVTDTLNSSDLLADDVEIDEDIPDVDAVFISPEQSPAGMGRYIAEYPTRKVKKRLHPVFALKTNLLLFGGILPDFKYYDITPNLEAELYFSKRWSLALDGAFSAWSLGDNDINKRWGYMSVGLEPRVWFSGNGRFVGLYAGLYGAYTQFNVMRDGADGHVGDRFGGGISLGVVAPLSNRIYLELGVRGGYHSTAHDNYYHQSQNFYYRSSDSKSGFALQTIRLSLMYRFGSTYDKK